MIMKLKQNCGFEYTAKLVRMFNDMSLSKELQDYFRQDAAAKNLGCKGNQSVPFSNWSK
jgi:cullin 1